MRERLDITPGMMLRLARWRQITLEEDNELFQQRSNWLPVVRSLACEVVSDGPLSGRDDRGWRSCCVMLARGRRSRNRCLTVISSARCNSSWSSVILSDGRTRRRRSTAGRIAFNAQCLWRITVREVQLARARYQQFRGTAARKLSSTISANLGHLLYKKSVDWVSSYHLTDH